jgi:hypothetical protein
MSRNLKILSVIAALLMMVVVAGLIINYVTVTVQQPGYFGRPPKEFSATDLTLYTMIRTVITTINIALLLVLVITYASIYLKTRSEFTVGLLIFALVFFMKDIVSSPLLLIGVGFGLFGFGVGPLALWLVILPDLFELIALSLLLYLSVKY